MDDKEVAKNRRALKALIDANGMIAHRFGPSAFVLPMTGKLRDWHIRANIGRGWLTMSTYLMELPPQGPRRTALLERVLEINDVVSVVKISKRDHVLYFDLEYHQEHVDAEAFSGLVGLMRAVCEDYYPELVRIATGESALEQLELAFQRPALPSGSEPPETG